MSLIRDLSNLGQLPPEKTSNSVSFSETSDRNETHRKDKPSSKRKSH